MMKDKITVTIPVFVVAFLIICAGFQVMETVIWLIVNVQIWLR